MVKFLSINLLIWLEPEMPRRISSIGLQNSNQLFGIIEFPKQPNVLKLVVMVQARVRGYLARINFRRRMFGVICVFTI